MLIIALVDLLLLSFGALASYSLRVSEFSLPKGTSLYHYLAVPVLSVACAAIFRVYAAAIRGHSTSVEKRIVVSQLLVLPAWVALIILVGADGFARSTVLIYGIVAPAIMICIRRFAATALAVTDLGPRAKKERVPVIIYGAGREGQLVFESLRSSQYKPLVFIDTDYTLVGRTVSGLSVYGIENLDKVVAKFLPSEMIIARSQSSIVNRRKLVEIALNFGLSVKVLPRLEELTSGHLSASDFRPVKVEDLLGRDPVPPDLSLMSKIAHQKCILISGAGGSIGSELARQCIMQHPKKLILLDNSEFALFQIHRELEMNMKTRRDDAGVVELIPILGDVKDEVELIRHFLALKVEIVLHAAAYKHVRMVQANVLAGVLNNVGGTIAISQAAIRSGVERFVLVSTDKAVRPTSVMGASKRVAELFVQALAAQPEKKTIFSIVRFGNVLGSTGSVVPIFKEQIEKGGPVRVTHKDVTRYFMLIPEAAQLVLQAGAMAKGGEVFVLDMGEPIKITKLAETMIELAGLSCRNSQNPGGDIEIEFTGLQEGEKLFEELQIGNEVSRTQNDRILLSREYCLEFSQLRERIERLKHVVSSGDIELSKRLVLELAHLGSEGLDSVT